MTDASQLPEYTNQYSKRERKTQLKTASKQHHDVQEWAQRTVRTVDELSFTTPRDATSLPRAKTCKLRSNPQLELAC